MADNTKTKPLNRGPTANQLQPPKRIQPHLLYAEDLEEAYGADAAKSGVDLEIINVSAGEVSVDPAGRETRKAIMLKLGDGKRILDKRLGLNQTNKRALISAFSTEYVSEWVGWITLFVILVEDRRNGGMVPAIRIKNVRPKLKPTFDYAANTRKRQEAAAAKTAKAPPAQQQPEPDEGSSGEPDLAEKIREQMERTAAGSGDISDKEREAIAAAERAQFTPDPEEET